MSYRRQQVQNVSVVTSRIWSQRDCMSPICNERPNNPENVDEKPKQDSQNGKNDERIDFEGATEKMSSTSERAPTKKDGKWIGQICFKHSINWNWRQIQHTKCRIESVGKNNKSFPFNTRKTKDSIGKTLSFADESVQLEIVLQNTSIRRPANAISQDLVMKVRSFYERDDISRVSPNAKDVRYFTDQSGKKELQQIRHLVYRLSEVYALFIMEYGEGENGRIQCLI